MDIRALLKQGSSLEEVEQSLLDLDSEFDFKCRHCGKCCKNQKLHFPSRTLEMVWNIIFSLLYVNYDTGKEFMPQFESAAEQLNALCRKFWSLEAEETEDSSIDKPKMPDLL